MAEMIVLALLGGICLGLNRILISRLGMGVGAFQSSFWNHVGGFALLLPLLCLSLAPGTLSALWSAPPWTYLGGVIGAVFVGLNSVVIPRIGTTRALALIISGQMVFSTLIDFGLGKLESPWMALLGVSLVVGGAVLPPRRAPAAQSTRNGPANSG